MGKEATTFDKLIRKIKNNRIVAYILVLGTLVIAISQFTDATNKLINFFSGRFFSGRAAAMDFMGVWKTEMLKDPWSSHTYYRYIFEFELRGDKLDGIIKKENRDGEQETESIWDITINDSYISFYKKATIYAVKSFSVDRPPIREVVEYKVVFKGKLDDNKINFIVTPDRSDFEPWRIQAVRETN